MGVDFMRISQAYKKGAVEVYPKFVVGNRSQDLMIRGSDFYAVWLEDEGRWSTDESDLIELIDRELDKYCEEHNFDSSVKVLHMWDSETGMIDSWHKYCQKQMRDKFHQLDEKLIFSNTQVNKKDYSSKRLTYPLEDGPCEAWNTLVSSLYNDEEKHKIEWAIGAIVTGASKELQKFMVLYGAAGTGKSTILNIVQMLFDGYYSTFDAKALGQSQNAFALEAFNKNPLVAIQHDGDLSHIEDNTRLNSLVSHELMTINEKFKSQYQNRFKCFLFMGTNRPVKITDAKSGLIRRLIDVTPSGNKIPIREYNRLMKQVQFELGHIASRCANIYNDDPHYYDNYRPLSMMGASNDFYNFVLDSYHVFKKTDRTTLKAAWAMYNTYCEQARVPYPLSQRAFKEELKTYFEEYKDRSSDDNGTRMRSVYEGFKTDIFETNKKDKEIIKKKSFELNCTTSLLDEMLKDCPAQYAKADDTPAKKWDNVQTKLTDICTTKTHYVKVPIEHIVIDFDLKDEFGKKSREKNLEKASEWPATYAEFSKGGAGIHLHYIYTGGDPNMLSRVYDDDIEVKVYTGNSSLRRRLSYCNDLPVAELSSGLPLKKENKMINFEGIKTEKALRTMIKRNLNKEYHASTKPSMDFIAKILNDAYQSGMQYDVTDMRNAILVFATNSTHQAEYCIKLANSLHYKSDADADDTPHDEAPIAFYDIEVFPNLFLVNWKIIGEGKSIVRMINPSPQEIEELIKYRLVGFNCRRYDNHIMYARLMGYNNEELYNLSKKIVEGSKNCFFSDAYNLSYTDIYDFASAGNKKSLKKLEVEMGIHHQELGMDWNTPVPEEQWDEVAAYCDNDVIATEAAWNYLKSDWTARQILADIAGMTVNSTTNSLTTRIIFGSNRSPQNEFNYRDMSKPIFDIDLNWDKDMINFLKDACPEMMAKPHRIEESRLPYFPDYTFDHGKSMYRGEEVGEGGYVYSEPGMYTNVALLDVASMHPHSLIAENLFGTKYTKRFRDLVLSRIYIKHEDWIKASEVLDGKLKPYVDKLKAISDPDERKKEGKSLSNALKTAINSVYGLTSAKFDNPFRDIRNLDNIVAKRGALFMIDLKHAVQERGFTVAHIKTDSIKIPNATPEIIQFVMDFGKRYGYTFEHEATYDRMCLVNDAVYIAKYEDAEEHSHGGWTATGTEFQIPYVFKTLFSKEPIEFEDMCETKQVTSALYLDNNEGLGEDEHAYSFIGKVGNFCPVLNGSGGGVLLREATAKDGSKTYNAATGSKGYRWMESETVRGIGDHIIDRGYFNSLVDQAVTDISKYGDFEWFVADDRVAPFEAPDNGDTECPFDGGHIVDKEE